MDIEAVCCSDLAEKPIPTNNSTMVVVSEGWKGTKELFQAIITLRIQVKVGAIAGYESIPAIEIM